MALADKADNARAKGNVSAARRHLRAALAIEAEAAGLVAEEPSRSVLLRSAASLALECGENREAERFIAKALAGFPPEEIAEELRDLLEQAHFLRHLELRNISLGEDEVQMSIVGESVGRGIARSEKFLRRIEDTQKLIYRTADRYAKQRFRDVAGPSKIVREELELYLSVPRAASMAITFRLGRPRQQLPLVGDVVKPNEVVSEMMTCLSLLNASKDEQLRERIGDDAYFRNFVSIAKQIAPDGKDITTVGFTASSSLLEEAQVPFRRAARTIGVPSTAPAGSKTTTVRGFLRFADHLRHGDAGQIKIVDDKQVAHPVRVPPGMMADVVRPLWEHEVVATCSLRGEKATLVTIERAGEMEPSLR